MLSNSCFFKIKILFFLLVLFLIPIKSFALQHQQESIIDWYSAITIHQDASMTVVENIRVFASGNQIKRGIYRDFPTKYKDADGNDYLVGFEVLEILRDGEKEPYHLEKQSNGQRVYIGEKNVFLPTGEHVYTITYKTDYQLGFFDDHDELYWNVTGNGWNFSIDAVMVDVQLPSEVNILSLDGFTGIQGSKDKNFQSSVNNNQAFFVTNQVLKPYEGLTIVVEWPKGFIIKPPLRSNNEKLVINNIYYVVYLIIILLYYLIAWKKVGDDPEKGTIIAQYTPPLNMSPAMMRYLLKMGYDSKVLTACLINLAVKGVIVIKEEKIFKIFGSKFTLSKNNNNQNLYNLSHDEKAVLGSLFMLGDSIDLANKNYKEIKKSIEFLQNSLKDKVERIYFITNKKYFFIGITISCLIFLVMIVQFKVSNTFSLLSNSIEAEKFFMLPFVFVFLMFFINLIRVIWNQVKLKPNILSLIFFLLILFLFGKNLYPFFGMFWNIIKETPWMISLFLFIFLVCIINTIFYYLLKSSTVSGRKILDQIEGFKLFLEVTEKDRLNFFNSPEKTPELFEKYLPYALALGVEHKWAEQFNGVFANIQDYQPSWYAGDHIRNLSSFSGSLSSSISSTIYSASTPPGSSSGGGGGGFSGGGGGGGGGGGW